ncbi:MAG TPA: acyltransferase [Acidimicrobiales bacterium]|jgi:peptidoglycan/LPS O-acetylase OafA/YrhL
MREPTPPRDHSLDGLRGVAALVVVVHHTLLASAAAVDPYQSLTVVPTSLSWLVYTPLHLLYGGGEAVIVFFVLSGYVLTLSARRPMAWGSYYVRRALRLYLPVWGALVFAALAIMIVPRHAQPNLNWWLNMHDHPIRGRDLVGDTTLVTQTPGALNPVLWSLQWEVLFSAALPLYLLVAHLLRRVPAVIPMLGLIGVLALGVHEAKDYLVALPVFGFGVLLAQHRDQLVHWRTWLHSGLASAIGFGAAAVLLTARWTTAWWVSEDPGRSPQVIGYATAVGPALGATLLVALTVGGARWRGWLETRPAQWLGTRSFSLYLVHEPIVVSVALLAGGFRPGTALLGMALALLAAEGFFRLVERPSLRLSRWSGRRVARREQGRPWVPAGVTAP